MAEIDLRKCIIGQKLVSALGWSMTYIAALPAQHFYDHLVQYPDGAYGTRTDDGHVYRNEGSRLPAFDHDVIEVLDDVVSVTTDPMIMKVYLRGRV